MGQGGIEDSRAGFRGFPVDVLVRDPSLIKERLREGDTFLEEITEKGRVMYESRHA